jgi:integrase/recombinase XerD
MKKSSGRPKGTTGKARAITDKELSIVLKVTALAPFHAKRNVGLIVLSNYLGLRAKELAALKIEDVFDGQALKKTLRLVASYTKGCKHRDLSLENKKVVAALTDYLTYRQATDRAMFNLKAPLFRSERKTAFSPNSMSRVITNIYKEAGFQDTSSHTGRRSLITKLAYAGIDLNSIRQIAGHRSILTTQAYIEDSPMRQRNILINL